jgi:hypothetical protein
VQPNPDVYTSSYIFYYPNLKLQISYMHVHVIRLTYYMCFVINYTILVVLTGSCKVKYAQRLLLFIDVLRHDGNCTCTAEYPTTVYSYFMPVQGTVKTTDPRCWRWLENCCLRPKVECNSSQVISSTMGQ